MRKMRRPATPGRTRLVALLAVAGATGLVLAVGTALAAPKTDKAAPAVTLAFPTANGSYNAAAWNAGCAPAGICGNATDQTGVASVHVAVYQSGSPTFVPATLGSPGAASTTWRLALPLPADGAYTVRVRATDTLGNTTATASETVAAFRTDTAAPAAPLLAEKPDDPTSNTNAHFRLTHPEAGVTFECRLDEQPFGLCGSTSNFNNLSIDEHCFDARAVDAAGNRGPHTRHCWSIVLKGGFPIGGVVDQPFAPGVTRPLNLVLGNPYNFAIRVTAVEITVGDGTGNAQCVGSTNLEVTQPFSTPVTVPANSTRSLEQLGVAPASWPQLTMPNLTSNQDACKGVTFSLAFTGQATKP